MELRQLEFFLKVAEEGSMSRAAETLGMTQPHLSRQIKALEEEWGWSLFERKGRGVELTEQGKISLREMSKVKRVLENGLKVMKRECGKQSLRIGYAPSLANKLLQKSLDSFQQLHPAVHLSLHDVSGVEMENGIEKGELDVIIGAEFSSENISWERLYQLPPLVVCRGDHPLTEQKKVDASALDQEKLLMLSRHDYPGYWEKILAYFQEKGINAKVIGEFDGIESIKMALKAGLGIAILARTSLTGEPDLKGVTIEDGMPTIDVSIGYASYKSPLPYLQDFISLIHESSVKP